MKYIAVISERYEYFINFMKTFDSVNIIYKRNNNCFETIIEPKIQYQFYNIHDHDKIRGRVFDGAIVHELIDINNHDYFFKCILNPMLQRNKND